MKHDATQITFLTNLLIYQKFTKYQIQTKQSDLCIYNPKHVHHSLRKIKTNNPYNTIGLPLPKWLTLKPGGISSWRNLNWIK
jgi:hypothetical protein